MDLGQALHVRPALLRACGQEHERRCVLQVLRQQGHGHLWPPEWRSVPLRRVQAQQGGLARGGAEEQPGLRRERLDGGAGGPRGLPAEGLPLQGPLCRRRRAAGAPGHQGGRPRVRRQRPQGQGGGRGHRGGRHAGDARVWRRQAPGGPPRGGVQPGLRSPLLAGQLRARPRPLARPLRRRAVGPRPPPGQLAGVRAHQVRLRVERQPRTEDGLPRGREGVEDQDLREPARAGPDAQLGPAHQGGHLQHGQLLPERHGLRHLEDQPRLVQLHALPRQHDPRDRPRHRHEPRAEAPRCSGDLPRPGAVRCCPLGEHCSVLDEPLPPRLSELHRLRR
mmetsp:Transcript_15414/g.42065  ORF Transcript_15414/g.42065 Transcript_15414/m.42065 type:complete len:335 (-) Transcript_15414:1069-2073(-)